MSTLNACDYAYPASNVAIEDFAKALAAAGITCVQRYLFDGGKGITARERAALLAAGIGIVYGYEGFATNWRGGAGQGSIDGQAAVTNLQRIGVKASRGIVVMMAIDEDAAGMSMLPAAKSYVNAAHKVLRHAGYGGAAPYGSDRVLDEIGRPGFQTYAWSGGRLSKHTALYQWLNGQHLAGALVDYGEVINKQALGAEWPDNEEDPLAAYTLEQIADAVWARKYKAADGQEHRMDVHLALARQRANEAADHARTIAKVMATLPARVAATQKALAGVATEVTAVRKAVAALEPAGQVVVDVAAIAAATSASVMTHMKSLIFRVGGGA